MRIYCRSFGPFVRYQGASSALHDDKVAIEVRSFRAQKVRVLAAPGIRGRKRPINFASVDAGSRPKDFPRVHERELRRDRNLSFVQEAFVAGPKSESNLGL